MFALVKIINTHEIYGCKDGEQFVREGSISTSVRAYRERERIIDTVKREYQKEVRKPSYIRWNNTYADLEAPELLASVDGDDYDIQWIVSEIAIGG